jgi:hypothetical protein
MPWTDEQCLKVFEEFWQNGKPRCPACHATVKTNLTTFIGGHYVLSGHCPRECGQFQMQRQLDPLLNGFRDWTDAEGLQVINDYFENGTARCPVDNSIVEVRENEYGGGNLVRAFCRRCGKSFDENFAKH